MELPELNRGRVSPACTSFRQQNGDLVSFNNFQSKTGTLSNPNQGLLVAGGVEGFTGQYLDSIELLLPGASEWTAGPKLPAAMKEGMAVNLNSHVLLTGGYQDFVGPVDEVDICMDREHGKQDKQRKKKIIFLLGGRWFYL